MRAARCARLSRNRQGLSTNTHVQLAECAQYVEGKGWTLGVTHGDDDLSASRYSTKPRPGYAALLADIAAGRVDVIVVTEMTCLYRRLEELLELIKLAETTALKRIETTDGMSYDLSTGEGVHQANHSLTAYRHWAVEIKRVAGLDAVEQLARYVELMNRDPQLAPVGGILAAQTIRPQARTLAKDRGFRCVVVDYDALRGLDPTNPRLF